MSYPNPCDTCKAPEKCTGGCEAWRIRYLHRQKQINAFAKKFNAAPTTKPVLPRENPCLNCTQSDFCDRICYARAKWWDVCMEKLRGRLRNG